MPRPTTTMSDMNSGSPEEMRKAASTNMMNTRTRREDPGHGSDDDDPKPEAPPGSRLRGAGQDRPDSQGPPVGGHRPPPLGASAGTFRGKSRKSTVGVADRRAGRSESGDSTAIKTQALNGRLG